MPVRFLIVVALMCAPTVARADDTPDPWTTVPMPHSEGHSGIDWRAPSAAALGALYIGFSSWAYFAWYYHHPHHDFSIGGDGWFGKTTYAGGADKCGHAWFGLTSTRLGYAELRAGGWAKTPAIAIAGALSASAGFLIEVKDGLFYTFSPSDLTGDFLGTALGVAQEIWPAVDRLVDYRVQYWPSDAYLKILDGATGADVNASNIAEDYSGETFLLAFHAGAVVPERLARYVDLTVGYQSRNYKPDLQGVMNDLPRRELFLGVSLNAQGLADDFLHGGVRKALHGLFEVGNLPFTSTPVVGVRSIDHDGHMEE